MKHRPFKFRVWHKPSQTLSFITGFDTEYVYTVTAKYVIEECILLQFTGLLDKNGKEVWEYDVVKCAFIYQGKPSTVTFNAVIVWNEYTASFQISYNSLGGFASDEIFGKYQIEVLGALPENQELMKR